MKSALRLIHIAASHDDSRRVKEVFTRAGLTADVVFAETAEAFASSLKSGPWDAVIADYDVPGFANPAGLAQISEAGVDVPYILLSDPVGEKAVAAVFKAGASDYVRRDDLERLVSVVKRQVRRAQVRRKRREEDEAFEQSERKYRMLFDCAGDAIIISDFDGNILDANKIACVRYGYTRLEMCRKRIVDIDPEETAAGIGERMERLKRLGVIIFERVHTARNGQRIPVEVSARIIDFGGRKNVLSTFRDIRERKLSEQALRESERRYRELFEHINTGVAVYEAVDDGRDFIFRDFNRAGEKIDGDSRERLIGKSIFKVRPGAAEFGLVEAMRRVWSTGRPESLPIKLYRDAELTGWYENFIYKLPSGEIVAVFEDVADRKRTEDELRLRENQLVNAMKIAELGDWEYDVASDTFTFNDNFYAIFGTTADKVGGYKMRSYEYARRFIHPDDMAVVAIETKKALETHDPKYSQLLEHRIIQDDGSVGHIAVRIFIVKDENGNTIKTYGVNQNITARIRAEEAMRQSEELLSLARSAAQIGIYDYNGMTASLRWDARARELLGVDREVTASLSLFLELVHPEDRREVKNMLRRTLKPAGGGRFDGEFRVLNRRAGGRLRWILVKGEVFFGGNRPLRLVGTVQDVTERKMMEEALQWELSLNSALAGLSGPLISPEAGMTDVSRVVLDRALQLTLSANGFVVLADEPTGEFLIHSSDVLQADATDAEPPPALERSPEGRYEGLMGYALTTRTAFFTNDPPRHPAYAEPALGTVPFERFLAVPVLLGTELVGQLALANPGRDYTDRDLDAVRRLAGFFALAVRSKRADERVKASLKEKTLLLKEIHHRIKNNLQVVMSLLNLQSFHLSDGGARALFRENQLRIRSIALVHERLYQSSDLSHVDFKEYITKLAVDLFRAYRIDVNTVRLSVKSDDVTLGIDASVPCGLIINELLLNSLKHAFPRGRKGNLAVSLERSSDDRLLLRVEDDGVGLGRNFDLYEAKSLGFSLVVALTEQLGGTIRVAREQGTKIEIGFKVKE